MLHCYNRGCGQKYDPEENTDESCRHHPGVPYFHDVYKGWSCCNKKSVDFTEFLNIQGCKMSKHSNEPPETEKVAEKEKLNENKVIEVRPPIKVAMPRPPIETAMQRIEPTVASALKTAIDNRITKAIVPTNNKELTEGDVPVGTACKNSGCKYSFTDTAADYEECVYHPGVPIFHEGMKYWSCCQKKTSDFAVFMSQRGCVNGAHKWFKENTDDKVVQCRHDWHQTATNVIVSIYAKMYDYANSTVEVNPIRLQVNLIFPEQQNATYTMDMELRGIIDVNKTTVNMFGSKVEIIMIKAEPGTWPKLDFPRDKLPPPKNNLVESKKTNDRESDEEFDLDDIEIVNSGLRLTELASKKA